MKKVVHLTSVHSPKDSRIFFRECVWLAENRFDVTYLVPADFTQQTMKNVRVKGVKKPRTRLGRPLVWIRLLRETVRIKPDIIHFHDPELLLTVPFLKWAVRSDVKVVYDVHEYLAASIEDKFWIPVFLRKPAARLAGYLEFFLGKWVDAQVFVVNGQRPAYDRWNTRKIVVHNYPDRDNFRVLREKSDRENSRKWAVSGFRLVHIGALYERRGIMTMLKTLDLLKKDGYRPQLILGGIFESTAFRQRVETFIKTHNLENQVQISGWIDYRDIGLFLARSHAAWLPHYPTAQHAKDSVCTKQLEAMLAGLPLVVSDIPILTRFVDESECGLSVPALDIGAHARAVKWLMDHPQKAQTMGKKGSQLVSDRYTWQRDAGFLKQLYHSL